MNNTFVILSGIYGHLYEKITLNIDHWLSVERNEDVLVLSYIISE